MARGLRLSTLHHYFRLHHCDHRKSTRLRAILVISAVGALRVPFFYIVSVIVLTAVISRTPAVSTIFNLYRYVGWAGDHHLFDKLASAVNVSGPN